MSVAFLVLLTSCLFETKEERSSSPGFVRFEIHLRAHSTALLKVASADTLFTLDSLKLVLSATGSTTLNNSYSISGRADTGNIVIPAKIFALGSLRTWTAKIIVLDTSLNPTKTDTVYNDSVNFTIRPGDTTFVTKTVNPKYSILRAKIVSSVPDSLPNNVKFLRLRVDGVMRDSISIGPVLRGIFGGSNTTLNVVGDTGIFLRSSNSGTNWVKYITGTSKDLNDVCFTNSTTGYVIGNAGTALKTTTGTSFTVQTSGTSRNLNGISASGNSFIVAVGDSGTIIISNASTWNAATTSGTTQKLNSVSTPNTSIAYAVGNAGSIVKTTNGAVNWSTMTSGTTQNLNSVFFTSTSAGFAVGDSGIILKTTDGSTWTKLTSGSTKNLQSVHFTSSSTGIAVGDGGTVLRTTNASSWTATSISTTKNLKSIWWTANSSAAAIVGEVATVLNSTTGTSWTFNPYGTKSFDQLLTYKYLTPNVSHTLLLDAIDTLSGNARGFQASKIVLLSPGKDTTVTPNTAMTKCGYAGFSNCL